MRAVLMFAILAVAVPDRPDPTPRESKPFKDQVQGQWQITDALNAGKPHAMLKLGPSTFIFAGDRMTIRKPKLEDNIYAIKLDVTKSPVAIEIVAKKIAGKDIANGRAVLGIIKLEGDVLTICFDSTGNPGRPTEFTSPVGSQTMLWQMKRIR
jgi:uncharacterized protein (TIGR03067 family)